MHQQHSVNSQRPVTSKPSPLQSKGSFNSCPHNHPLALVGHHHEKHCKMTTQHQSSPPQCSYLWQESNQMFFPSKVQQCYCSVPNEYHQAVQDYLPCHPNSAFVSVNPSYQKRILMNNDAVPNVVAYKSQCPTHFSNTQQPCSAQSHQIQHSQVSPHYHQTIQHQHFHQQPHFVVHNVSNVPQVQLQKQGVTCACHSKNSHRHMLQQQMSLQANTHYQQYHYRLFQKRPMDEGEKLKRSRDGWDYELSQDLQAKQVEMLKRKYGGEAKANRAARVIQQAYRRYSLDKNFAKLKLEVDKRRLSRRFNEAGRSKTIWMEACPNASPYADHVSAGNYAQMRIPAHGRTEYAREKSKWVSPEYYQQNFHGMAITTTTISEERTVRKEEKTVVLPVFDQPDSRNYEEYNVVKKLDSRVAPVHHHHMHHSEHSAVSKGSSFCLPQYPVGSYDQISNETYPMLQQESSGIDNGVDFDTDMVAELPPAEDTMDDEMFDQHFIQSDASHEELQKGGEAVFNLVSSHERRPRGPAESENAGYAMVNLRSCNSLRKGEVKNGNEVKSFSSPVWKRKMVGGNDGLEEHSSVVCRETELPIVPQMSYVTHGAAHSKPDLTRFGHHSNLPSKPRVSDKQRKRTYRIGLNLFNKKPEKGICYLIERHFLDNRPSAVARFLIARKGLSKQMIGEYLGNLQKQFNMEVLRCFAEEIDLTNLQIDVALRKFQSFFRMPGEAQKIERLMEAFASHYCHCNPDVVKSFNRPDTVFLLAFATIMLNTDLHNKSIKSDRKMKLEDFIKNLRGIDDGEDVNAELLAGIYERIKASEFVPGSDHVSQVAKVEQMIVGKKPQLAELHRRLVCYCRLYEVQDPNRKEKFGLHQREVFLFNDMIMVTKIIGKKKNAVTYSFRCTFSLSGMTVYLFESQYYRHGIRLTNGSNGKSTIMLNARNEHDRSKFVEDLKEAILEMNEMESLRIEEELMKQQIMKQKHCNYNRHSKDSGVVDIELLRPSDFGGNRLSTAVDGSARVSSSPSLPDVVEYVHRGSAGSLDSGLVSIHT